ncbi:MAG: alanine dehydrogenase, partial [Desulfobulbales bacterium]
MIIGVPKEIKDKEFRVGIVPVGVRKMTEAKHVVLVESGAGLGSGISDQEFTDAGARLVKNGAAVYREADLVMKVKEPLEQEYAA